MNATDYEAVVYDGAVYCTGCLPEGVSVNDETVSPIFGNAEVDSYPSCDHCGARHEYVSLTSEGIMYEATSGNHAEIFHMDASEFLNAEEGSWMRDWMEGAIEDWEDAGHVAEFAASLAGWYWWTCSPGCLPDSDAFGPFKTELDAAIDNLNL